MASRVRAANLIGQMLKVAGSQPGIPRRGIDMRFDVNIPLAIAAKQPYFVSAAWANPVAPNRHGNDVYLANAGLQFWEDDLILIGP